MYSNFFPALPRRFVTIDGLRGIAAISVVFFHFHDAIIRNTPEWLPGWLSTIVEKGYLGVDIFFVISGFVIAFSVREGPYSWNFLGRFALRRSLRLDPPYWLTIVIELALVYLGLYVMPSLGTPIPSREQVVAHLLYAQNLTGYGDIIPIFWTLAYEIQFYVFFVFLLVAWSNCKAIIPVRFRSTIVAMFLIAVFAVSIATRFSNSFVDIEGLAIDRWFQFFLGVLTYWTVAGRCHPAWLAGGTALIAILASSSQVGREQLIAVTAVGLLIGCAARGNLGSFLGNELLQFLGRRSYSLYLLHLPIGWRGISAMQVIIGEEVSPIMAWLVLGIGILVSIIAADLMYRFVERPTMAWSKRIALNPTEATRIGGTIVASSG